MKRRILFIINPKSGQGRHRTVERAIKTHLDRELFDHEIAYTQYKGHGEKLALEAADRKLDVVAIAGGDGSINEVARGIYGSGTLLAVIPTGSGNGLARHLGIPLRVKNAVQLINELSAENIDTGFINSELFVSIAGLGFDAMIAEKFENASQRGFMAYFRLVAAAFYNYKPQKYTLEINNEEIKRKALLINFANSGQFGYNTGITPHASVTDSMLDVSIMQKPSLLVTPLLLHLLYFHRIDQSQYVESYRAKEMVITKRKKKHPVNIDGEPRYFEEKQLHVEVKPASLPLIGPK
ncbi:MAG: diacylglycerol kinase family lipid kinase [Bacteroidales bacterium]|nr:diacylglycerol kinase family lipid kinase [Bacteroidales bacterium]MCF8338213.1 diacylglycerol kinase family lipid kinase [Bacteroidales bacterium]